MAKATSRRTRAVARKRSAKKSAGPTAAAVRTKRARKGARPAPAGAYRAKIRMYRQGLGDCFLLSLKRSNGKPDYKILIDCGVILGTTDPAVIMTKVVDDIVAATGGDVATGRDGKVDLLLATHQHWDHLSGFIQAEPSFKHLKVGQVWVAWTEDPTDDLAKELRGEREQAMAALQMAANTMRMAGSRSPPGQEVSNADVIADMLGFFGAAGGSTSDALDKVKAMAPVRYCRPSDAPIELGDPNVRLYVLGPPHDAKLIRRTLPSKSSPETYGLALDDSGVMPVDVHKALASKDDDLPFGTNYTIPFDIARGMDFFRRYFWGPGTDAPTWRSIDSDWLDSGAELALALDSATNNTSLVLAIELAGRDVLLFVADAQVGNWESWHDLAWTVDGKKVTGPDLLARTIFYKVGHHGSHNATLKENGLELMTKLQIAAIPVNHEMAVKKRWGKMPLEALVTALRAKTNDKVIQIDQSLTAPIQGVTENQLFFDIEL
jgi:hypothetical protein